MNASKIILYLNFIKAQKIYLANVARWPQYTNAQYALLLQVLAVVMFISFRVQMH